MRASRSISISLIISFIAMFMCGDLFTEESIADCGRLTIVSQLGFGYLAGGAVVAGMCAIGVTVDEYTKYKLITEDSLATAVIIGPAAFVIASSGTVYGIGQIAGCRGSFTPTLVGGAILTPVVDGIIGGIIGGIKNEGGAGCLMGGSLGVILAPIGATIAYHLTKEENNPGKKEIIVPLMSLRF
ncbi:hypothetical protein FJZ31_16725 [Candidatus Poribacteria bacterium]|nr:hypothetical protein [Candidatus Poribacteria bacterium]